MFPGSFISLFFAMNSEYSDEEYEDDHSDAEPHHHERAPSSDISTPEKGGDAGVVIEYSTKPSQSNEKTGEGIETCSPSLLYICAYIHELSFSYCIIYLVYIYIYI
jgi:hypothetical protein